MKLKALPLLRVADDGGQNFLIRWCTQECVVKAVGATPPLMGEESSGNRREKIGGAHWEICPLGFLASLMG